MKPLSMAACRGGNFAANVAATSRQHRGKLREQSARVQYSRSARADSRRELPAGLTQRSFTVRYLRCLVNAHDGVSSEIDACRTRPVHTQP
jgi:hypothetical protein